MAKPPATPKNNDARRLIGILLRAQHVRGDGAACDGWLAVVGIQNDSLSDEDKVTLGLEVMADFRRLLSQVDSQYAMTSTATGYKSMISRLRLVASAQYMHGTWDAIQKQFRADQNIVILEGIADALPHEGETAEFEAIQTLQTEVDDLLKRVQDSDLPPYHRHYAEMMLNRLQRSLRHYVLFGSREAHEFAAYLIGIDSDLASSQPIVEEVSQLSDDSQSLLTKVTVATHRVVEWSKNTYYVGHALPMVYNAANVALPYLTRFLPN